MSFLQINRLPFSLIFVSSFLPLVGAFFGIPIYHVPAGLLLITGAIAYSITRNPMYLGRIWLYSLGLLFTILVAQILSGRGFVTLAFGGYVVIFGFLFFTFFASGRGITFITIIRGISFLNMFFILGLIVEFAIVITGGQVFLTDTLNAYPSGGYKNYNPADVPRLIGLFQSQGGLNSVLLGSQIAPMLSLFAAIWFGGVSRLRKGARIYGLKFWFVLSVLMLIVTINGTVLLLMVVTLTIYLIFL